jgi:hypothetical protein
VLELSGQAHLSTSTDLHLSQEPLNNLCQIRLPSTSQVPAVQISRVTNEYPQPPKIRHRPQSTAISRPGYQLQVRSCFDRISDVVFPVHHGVYLNEAYRIPASWYETRFEDSDGAEIEK